MSLTKDGFYKSFSGAIGNDNYLLDAGGGHIGWGNAASQIPYSNGTINSNLNADMTDGLHVHSGRNNEANKIVRTDGSGYIQAGWINTTSGDMGSTAFSRIYVSNDAYIRYVSVAQFKTGLFGSQVGSPSVPIYWTGSAFATCIVSFGNQSYGEHNANNINDNGIKYYTSNGPSTSLGATTSDGALYSQAYSTSWVAQIAQDYRNGGLYVRGKNNGTWQSWYRVWDNRTTYVSGGKGYIGSTEITQVNNSDTVDSYHALGITNTSNYLIKQSYINPGDDSNNDHWYRIATIKHVGSSNYKVLLYISTNYPNRQSALVEITYRTKSGVEMHDVNGYFGTIPADNIRLYYDTTNYTTVPAELCIFIAKSSTGSRTVNTRVIAEVQRGAQFPNIITLDNNVLVEASLSSYTAMTYANFSGNASTATKLATTRTITIGATGRSFDGSTNISWTLANIFGSTSIGSTTKPIYWSGSAFAACTYELKATINNGTANRMSWYNGANSITSASNIWTNGTKLGINTTSETNYNLYVNGSEKIQSGSLQIYPTGGNYNDGIRIHARSSDNSWTAITFCGSDNTGDTGISANSWFIGNNNGNFYITRNGSSSGTVFLANVSNIWHFQNRLSIDTTGRVYPYSTSTRRAGMYGVYDSTKLGHIWSMGTGYMISDNGSDPANLYGLAYFHTNWSNNSTYNTNAANKTAVGTYAGNHQVGWFINGVLYGSIGDYIWSRNGFIKNGSNNNYVLLGGGGHKALSDFSMSGHTHTFILGATIITTNGSTYNSINGPFNINTSASASKSFSISRDSESERVNHWVDDSTYHIEYTNNETSNSIAFRFINTDTESPHSPSQASDTTIYLNSSRQFYPNVNNTGSIGTSGNRWSKLYVGTADSYGSTTKPIYWNAGVPTVCAYELKATINNGTANRIAWYSGANAISSGSIVTDGGYLGSVSYLSVNTSHQTSYRLYVNGNSIFNGHVYPGVTNTYDLGSSSLRWRIGYYSTSILVGATGYTITTSAVAGTLISAGSIEMSGSTPYIDFHNGLSTANFTTRIIEDSQGRIHIQRGTATTDNLTYANRGIAPLLYVQGILYSNSNIESAGYFLNNVSGTSGGYYLYGNNTQYGRLYISTIGTASDGTTQGAQGVTYLFLGNSIAQAAATATTGANNARGMIRLYHTNTGYTDISSDSAISSTVQTFTLRGATSSTANTEAWTTLILGNNGDQATTNAHNRGNLRIYSAGVNYTDIRSQGNGNRTFYLPNYAGDMYAIHATNNNAIGGGEQPVYVASNGRVTATSYALKSTVNNGTANKMAYYSADRAISATANIISNGSYIHIINDDDVSGTAADTSAPFTIGTLTSTHLSMDNNEILVKSNATTPATLYLQDSTGTVQVNGSGGLKVWDINIATGATTDAAKRTISSNSTLYLNSATSTSLIFQKAGAEMARFDTSSDFVPSATNTRNIGSTSLRWKNIYSVLGNYSGQVTVSVATGTAPFAITSTTKVNNLNVDLLDNYHSTMWYKEGLANPNGKSDKPWHLIAEFTQNNASSQINTGITLFVRKFYGSTSKESGILVIRCRYESAAATPSFYHASWSLNNSLPVENFIITSKRESNVVTLRLYCKLTGWNIYAFTKISEGGWEIELDSWKLYSATYSSTYAMASIPTNETQVQSSNIDISNNTSSATVASKLGTSNIGSATKGIYLDAGTPKAMTYSLNANILAGTANRMARYSGTNEISSSSTIYASNTQLTVGGTSAPANSGIFQVIGTSTMQHIYPQSNGAYDLGKTDSRWRTGYYNTSILVGATGYTATTSAVAGTLISAGSIEMSGSTPYIDFHNGLSTADFTTRIIEDSQGRIHIQRGTATTANLTYANRGIAPLLYVQGILYSNSNIESGGYFMNNVSGTSGGYYLYGNNAQYGRLYIQKIGTANSGDGNATRGAQGEVYLYLGNNIDRPAAGTEGGANNARGRIIIYGSSTIGTTIMHSNWSGSNLTVIGTTNATANETGESCLILGNSTKKSDASASSTGYIYIYGDENCYHRIMPGAPTANRSHYFPNANGWIVTGGNGSDTGVGSTTNPVYLNTSGVLAGTTYSLFSTVNAGTTNRIAWYNGANSITSGSITTDGGYLGSVSYLSINTAHQTGYRLYVNGTGNFENNIWVRGSSRYLRIGPQNATWAHYETNADTGHWFNKRIDVNGDIYLYGTSVRMQKSNEYVYSSGFYHNSYGSATYLLRSDGGAAAFNWSGQSGQPTWVWGGNSQHTYYVYNPSNFRVSYANSAGNADTVDSYHANRFAFTYNSANYGGSSSVTVNDLVTNGVSNASHGMIYAATDNPVGSANWVHVWSQQWTIGTTSSWVSQIALGVQQGTGIWYRTTSGNIVGRAWTRVLDSSNYTSYVNNYYWANVKVSTSSSTSTTPTFGRIYMQPHQGSWVSGMTTNPSIWYNNSNAIDASSYWAFLGMKSSSSHVINFGGLGNNIGFYGYYSGRTENSYDWSFTVDMTNGVWTTTKQFYSNSTIYSYGFYHRSYGSAAYLLRSDGGVAAFNWSGQSGQPTWVWGGNSQHTYYVYNPSNFSVNYANSAGSATNASWLTPQSNFHTGKALGYAQTSNGPLNGSNTTGTPTNWSHYILMSHDNGQTYYHYQLAFPFWGPPMYQRKEGGSSTSENQKPWYTFLTTENYTSYINNYYWANVKVSTSSSISTTPQFGYVGIGTAPDSNYARLSFIENENAICFRKNTSYKTCIQYKASGNEALIFATQQAVTSFIFKCGYSMSNGSNWGSSVTGTPSVQIKNQSLYVNTALDSGNTPGYNFCVTGDSKLSGNIEIGTQSNTNVAKNGFKIRPVYFTGDYVNLSSYTTWVPGIICLNNSVNNNTTLILPAASSSLEGSIVYIHVTRHGSGSFYFKVNGQNFLNELGREASQGNADGGWNALSIIFVCIYDAYSGDYRWRLYKCTDSS